jgi:hypothetical protein
MLSAEQCPIADATQQPINTADWRTELVLVGPVHRVAVPGVWLSSFEPWTLSFQAAETKAWPDGAYAVRLAYITPDPSAPRRFEQALGMSLEVIR